MNQVQVELVGLLPEERSREDLDSVAHLEPTMNLEGKLQLQGEGDVTIPLDLDKVTVRLKSNMELSLVDSSEAYLS